MPVLTQQSVFEANLAAVAATDAEVAGRLKQTAPAEAIEFVETPQGVPAATLNGRQLCSRHRPLEEAARLVDKVDLIEHAVFIVSGFGMGYHVQRLAERLGRTGAIIVYEPDIALLRAVLERVDHSEWIGATNVMWVSDPADRAALSGKFERIEAIIGLGVEFIEHPASRSRLGDSTATLSATVADLMTSVRTSLATTLVRSANTVANLVLNLDHYAGGEGVKPLEHAAEGYPAVVVSAGPSLQKNLRWLKQPGVRDRCVIIAVQTTLKPLLQAGIRPHFVTALDYHEISKRFYEGLTAEDVEGVTLVAEPKAHPAILDSFPGPVRCCASKFLDALLGDGRDMGRLPEGATVAHLSVYLARYLGCDPIAMIGQDLGFTDGLYYAPGTAIQDVWAPELGPFNTIEMMQWQRIARAKAHLHRLQDINGRTIFSDTQMVTYLQQFERDFLRYEQEGRPIIDATEGGVQKKHTVIRALRDVLDECATRPLPDLSDAPRELDPDRLRHARQRAGELRRDIGALREISVRTIRLLKRMMDDQRDRAKMEKHFKRLNEYRKQVDQREQAFQAINHLNQIGLYKRMRADRRLQLQTDLDALARQRLELERDVENVRWIADAADEMIDHLAASERLLTGRPAPARSPRRRRMTETAEADGDQPASHAQVKTRVAALVPIDPNVNGLGQRRDLSATVAGRSVLQATLERLGRCRSFRTIILIAPEDFDAQSLIDRSRIDREVIIERCADSPFGPEQRAIAAARLFSPTSWRGGITGISAADEIICPGIMRDVMDRHGLTAGLLVGPDWPLVDPSAEHGCDAVVNRHLENPAKLDIVFTQSPPGLCGYMVSRSLMDTLARRTRLSTFGSLLVYQPHLPQRDPIVLKPNVQVDHRLRHSLVRATCDSLRWRERLDRAIERGLSIDHDDALRAVALLEQDVAEHPEPAPQHVIIELTSRRASDGAFSRRMNPDGISRPEMAMAMLERVLESFGQVDDLVVTFAGLGDPLLHPRFDEAIRLARDAGAQAVHVRTELPGDQSTRDRLLDAAPEVVSVDLQAHSAATYQAMMGGDRFEQVLRAIDDLARRRAALTDHQPHAAIPGMWVVPRIQRASETFEEIEPFFDHWQHVLGAAVIDGAPRLHPPVVRDEDVAPAVPPLQVERRELDRRMTVYADGCVPVSEIDLAGQHAAGCVSERSPDQLWRDLCAARRDWRTHPDRAPLPLRIYQ